MNATELLALPFAVAPSIPSLLLQSGDVDRLAWPDATPYLARPGYYRVPIPKEYIPSVWCKIPATVVIYKSDDQTPLFIWVVNNEFNPPHIGFYFSQDATDTWNVSQEEVDRRRRACFADLPLVAMQDMPASAWD